MGKARNDMNGATGLQNRGGTYYFRRRVPDELRPIIGKRELKVSLRTGDKAAAKLAAVRAAIDADATIEAARKRLIASGPRSAFTAAELEMIRREYVARFLREDEAWRIDHPGVPLGDGHGEHLDRVVAPDADDDAPPSPELHTVAEEVLAVRGERVEPGSYAEDQLLATIRQAVIEAVNLATRRDSGVPVATPSVSTEAALPFSKAVQRWERDRQPKPKSLMEADKLRRDFVALHGDLPLGAVTRGHVVALKDAYLTKAGKRGGAAATGNKKLGLLSAILELAVADGFIPTNPAKGVKLSGRSNARRAFRVDELQRLFALPVFTEGERTKAAAGEAGFWLPMLALFSGARLRELCQLQVADFREHPTHGPYFEIHERAEGSSVKTAASSREVPVHPQLIALGLLRYVQSLPADGRLFPELPVGDDGAVVTAAISMYLNRTLGRAGLTDRALVFHSFRHTFASFGRDSGIGGGTLRALMGHDSDDVHEDYGEVTLRAKAAALAVYRVDGLDLSRIRMCIDGHPTDLVK